LQRDPEYTWSGGADHSRFRHPGHQYLPAQLDHHAPARDSRQRDHDPRASHRKVWRLFPLPRQSHGVAHLLPGTVRVWQLAGRYSQSLFAGAGSVRANHSTSGDQWLAVGLFGAAAVLPAGIWESDLQLSPALDCVVLAGFVGCETQLYSQLWAPLRTG